MPTTSTWRSLVEGTLKTFLSVWYKDYAGDIDNLKLANVYDKKKDKILEPDGLTLEPLRKYFDRRRRRTSAVAQGRRPAPPQATQTRGLPG